MITLIAALAENRAIGLRGDLIYHLPADLHRFKELTTGHTIVMGRRTFESLPKGALPNRRNIVLSRKEGMSFVNAETYASFQEALNTCQEDEHVFVIGGASVYEEALPLADYLELTHILDAPKEADVFFPEIDYNQWEVIKQEAHEDTLPYVFASYKRK